MSAYPIVRSEHLDPAARRGPFGLGRKRREHSDLPKAGAHEVWVYRVDGRYVVNHGELSPRDDDVVRADLVCLVDRGDGVVVTVDLTIPSADGTEFALRVSFSCTVLDPARVVRDNLDAKAAILAYLRRDSKLGHLALNYRMDDLTQVRNDVAARIRAYAEVKPPVIHGLMLSFVGVEIPTPQEVADFHRKRRDAGWDDQLRKDGNQFRRRDQLEEDRHEQVLAGQRRKGKHATEPEDQDHDQGQRARALQFARQEAEFAFEAFGEDPRRAMLYAEARGQVDAKDVAESMISDRREQDLYAREQRQLDREDERKALDWQQQDATARRHESREERMERERFEREAWLEAQRAKREDKRARRAEDRADRNRQLEIKLDVLRELAKNGHLDMVNLKVEQLVADISGTGLAAGSAELPGGAATPIEAGRTDRDPSDSDDEAIDVDVEVRDEDDD
ncbi:hypothetical protein AB0M54_39350 [Actinoplanes sp. NPDC051470]|uniref:hypothetical protein n=1 Tax=Actinoplanes sp. NPDC051470 TaxID=3157224 RepID=UPI0034486756